jgi:Phosphotriesterase family
MDIHVGGLARWNAPGIGDNLILDLNDYDAQADEFSDFVTAGGSCLVDVTCEVPSPQPQLLERLSEQLDFHIVAGCGSYVQGAHPNWLHTADVEDVAAFNDAQLRDGLAGTPIRPGIIGEIGTSDPPTADEEKVLRARVGAATGTGGQRSSDRSRSPRGAHCRCPGNRRPRPGPHRAWPYGRSPRRGLSFRLRLGAVVEFDTFGFEGYFARALEDTVRCRQEERPRSAPRPRFRPAASPRSRRSARAPTRAVRWTWLRPHFLEGSRQPSRSIFGVAPDRAPSHAYRQPPTAANPIRSEMSGCPRPMRDKTPNRTPAPAAGSWPRWESYLGDHVMHQERPTKARWRRWSEQRGGYETHLPTR